jgi:hypothetical protein
MPSIERGGGVRILQQPFPDAPLCVTMLREPPAGLTTRERATLTESRV